MAAAAFAVLTESGRRGIFACCLAASNSIGRILLMRDCLEAQFPVLRATDRGLDAALLSELCVEGVPLPFHLLPGGTYHGLPQARQRYAVFSLTRPHPAFLQVHVAIVAPDPAIGRLLLWCWRVCKDLLAQQSSRLLDLVELRELVLNTPS